MTKVKLLILTVLLVGCTQPATAKRAKVLAIYSQRSGVLVSVETNGGELLSCLIPEGRPIPKVGDVWVLVENAEQRTALIKLD